MRFLTKPLGLGLLALVVYTATLMLLFMRSKAHIAEALAGPPQGQEAAKTPEFVYWNFKTNEVTKMIQELQAERESLQKRSDALTAAEARQAAERKDLERLRTDIETYRKELSSYLVEVKSDEMKNLKTEVAIVSGMQPASIVALFKEKSDDDVVKLLALMKPEAVTPIIEAMMAEDGDNNKPSARRASRLLEKLQRLKQAQAQ